MEHAKRLELERSQDAVDRQLIDFVADDFRDLHHGGVPAAARQSIAIARSEAYTRIMGNFILDENLGPRSSNGARDANDTYGFASDIGEFSNKYCKMHPCSTYIPRSSNPSN
jgi:hypothetical protein